MKQSMNRRKFIKISTAGAAVISMPWFIHSVDRVKDRPNVLFISVDDLNDWIGCQGGHPDVQTPNFDRLAQRGVLFTNAHCSAPLCNPSRASFMTGILPSTSGVYVNQQPWRGAEVLKKAVTIPQHFMAHGYRVVGGGKIYHGRFPDPSSWQEYFPSMTKTRPNDPNPPNRPLNGIPNARHFDWGPLPADINDEDMGDWKVATWAIEELGKKHDRPFFLGVGIFRPHLPWYVPKKYSDMYPPNEITLPNVNENDLDDVPPIGRKFAKSGLSGGDYQNVIKYNQWRNAVSGYLACVSFADAQVGRVLSALDRTPYATNTVIILWGDHGWHLGEKLHWRKFALWEEATHNPLIVVAPGITEPGGRCRRPVSLIDIYPTLIDLCGLKPKKELEGKNLMSLLKNPKAPWDNLALTTYRRNNHSIRSELWRYIRYRDGTEELYDHENDELEWHNLADKPEYENVKKELTAWLPKVNAPDAPRL